MKKIKWKQMIYSLMLVLSLALSGSMAVYAEGTARMALTFDSGSYEAGSIVTAQIYVYDAEFNAAGFSLEYNTERMIPVLADGTDSDNSNQLITIHNKYDDEEGTGMFSVLSRNVNKENGTAEALFYMSPNAGKTAAADNSGMLIGEISFRMLESGAPDVKFAVNEESVDFYAVPCLILNEGAQMETAYADIQAGDETVQNVDVSKEVIDQVDAKPESQKTEEASSNTASDEQSKNENTVSDNSSDETNHTGESNKSGETVSSDEENAITEKSESQNTGDEKNKNEKGNNDSQSGQWSAVYTVAVVLVILIVAGIIVIILKKKKGGQK